MELRCYVGKATKIFIAVVILIVIIGLVLGIVLRQRRDSNAGRISECSSGSCSEQAPRAFPTPNTGVASSGSRPINPGHPWASPPPQTSDGNAPISPDLYPPPPPLTTGFPPPNPPIEPPPPSTTTDFSPPNPPAEPPPTLFSPPPSPPDLTPPQLPSASPPESAMTPPVPPALFSPPPPAAAPPQFAPPIGGVPITPGPASNSF